MNDFVIFRALALAVDLYFIFGWHIFNYNNENIIIEILCENVINLVKKISDHHIKYNDTYTRTYIFFDGIPSKAKIKEQMVRRIYPEIIYYIKKDLKHTATALELDIDIKLLNDMPPSIGINKPIVIKLKQLLEEIYDSQKGKFNINELTNYGEAEHQLMLVLEQLKISNILLVSPDADLILLSIINYVKNIKIDILRISTNIIYEFDIRSYDFNINKSPFYYTFAYIFIDKILEEFNLNTKQAQLDIAYILLLLGDDFIPIKGEIQQETQKELLQSQGISEEPIILFKTKNGKYELGEGWHRTTQTFIQFPDGFIQPNVYIGLNAKWLD